MDPIWIISLIPIALTLFILYLIIKGAVKNGMLEAWNEKERISSLPPMQKIQKDYEDGKISRKEAKLMQAELANNTNK